MIAPGSRNAPLSFAAHDAAAAGMVRLHTRLDERSAGFLALGLSKVGARAAVICTSGTAVSQPAPSRSRGRARRLPLVVVTADRPARLRGTGANQTTDQVGIFGRLITTHDLDEVTEIPLLGDSAPLHLNVQLDDPLVPADNWVPTFAEPTWRTYQEVERLTLLPPGPRTVVVAGDDAGPPARTLAERANWPLFAEPSSGSRNGANTLRCYRLLLDSDLGRRIERVVVYGTSHAVPTGHPLAGPG